jgi:hypothetical protein
MTRLNVWAAHPKAHIAPPTISLLNDVVLRIAAWMSPDDGRLCLEVNARSRLSSSA